MCHQMKIALNLHSSCYPMLSFKYSHAVILCVNVINQRTYNFQREGTTNLLEMADEFDIDDLLEAPYQKVKNEEAEVNMNKVLFGSFLIQSKQS